MRVSFSRLNHVDVLKSTRDTGDQSLPKTVQERGSKVYRWLAGRMLFIVTKPKTCNLGDWNFQLWRLIAFYRMGLQRWKFARRYIFVFLVICWDKFSIIVKRSRTNAVQIWKVLPLLWRHYVTDTYKLYTNVKHSPRPTFWRLIQTNCSNRTGAVTLTKIQHWTGLNWFDFAGL